MPRSFQEPWIKESSSNFVGILIVSFGAKSRALGRSGKGCVLGIGTWMRLSTVSTATLLWK